MNGADKVDLPLGLGQMAFPGALSERRRAVGVLRLPDRGL